MISEERIECLVEIAAVPENKNDTEVVDKSFSSDVDSGWAWVILLASHVDKPGDRCHILFSKHL